MTDEESESDEAPKKRKLTMQEKAIYLESDALQIEMGNIVSKTGTGGTIIYDTARTNQHKDRYSALAMAVRLVAYQASGLNKIVRFCEDHRSIVMALFADLCDEKFLQQ